MAESNQQYIFTTRPLLLPEALGFSAQLLLDDIINIANNALQDGVNGMEEFLQNWTDKRIEAAPPTELESIQEVEQGLVAFQTLLEYHTDIAFDFFEAWSLRNIFAVPPELDVVLPHHEGLDLSIDREWAAKREKELMDEIEELHEEINGQRLLKRQFMRAVRGSSVQRRRAEQRFIDVSSLLSSPWNMLAHVPNKVREIFDVARSLPVLEPSIVSSVVHAQRTEVGKRSWETGKSGYVNWAVARLVDKTKGSKNDDDVENLRSIAEALNRVEMLKVALSKFHTHGEQRDREE